MSRIYFATRDDEVELRGAERHWLGFIAEAPGLQVLVPSDPSRLDRLVARFRPVPTRALDERSLRTMLRVGWEDTRIELPDGSTGSVFEILLNTALAAGSDPVRLGARLHGQCERHAWFAAEDRAWAAGIIDAGRASGIFRKDMGWEGVAEFLRGPSPGPVVTSYSVTEGFPALSLVLDAGMGPEPHLDVDFWWDAFSRHARWDLSFKALSESRGGFQITPANLAEYDYFGSGLNAYDVDEALQGI